MPFQRMQACGGVVATSKTSQLMQYYNFEEMLFSFQKLYQLDVGSAMDMARVAWKHWVGDSTSEAHQASCLLIKFATGRKAKQFKKKKRIEDARWALCLMFSGSPV